MAKAGGGGGRGRGGGGGGFSSKGMALARAYGGQTGSILKIAKAAQKLGKPESAAIATGGEFGSLSRLKDIASGNHPNPAFVDYAKDLVDNL